MRALVLSTALALALAACSGSKQYFNPQDRQPYAQKSIGTFKQAKDFLGSDDTYNFYSSADGKLKITHINSQQTSEYALNAQVVSIALRGNIAAFVDALNTVYLYDLANNRALFSRNFGPSYGVLNPLPSPNFSDNLVLVPTLDGKLVVLNYKNNSIVRVITLGTKEFFNNVIYFQATDEQMIALSASKATTIYGSKSFGMLNSFKTATSDNENIYLFTASGDVIRTDFTLHELARRNFEFASFKSAWLHDGALYALEYSGKLLKLNPQNLETIAIWDFGSKLSSTSAFIDGKLIINSKIYPLQ